MSKNKIIALKKPGEFCEDLSTELLHYGGQRLKKWLRKIEQAVKCEICYQYYPINGSIQGAEDGKRNKKKTFSGI